MEIVLGIVVCLSVINLGLWLILSAQKAQISRQLIQVARDLNALQSILTSIHKRLDSEIDDRIKAAFSRNLDA